MDRQREREGEGEREGERIRPGVKQLGLRRRTLDRAPLIVLGNPRIRGVLRPLPKRSYFCRVATPNIWPRVCAFWKFTIAVRCGFLCDLDLPIWHFASIRFAYRYLWRGKGVIFRYHEVFENSLWFVTNIRRVLIWIWIWDRGIFESSVLFFDWYVV